MRPSNDQLMGEAQAERLSGIISWLRKTVRSLGWVRDKPQSERRGAAEQLQDVLDHYLDRL